MTLGRKHSLRTSGRHESTDTNSNRVEGERLVNRFRDWVEANVRDATYLFRTPGELVHALLAMNVLMPIFTIVLISLFDLNPAVKIALVALSVSPIPPLLPNKIVKEGGTDSYSIGLLVAVGLMAISSLIAVILRL